MKSIKVLGLRLIFVDKGWYLVKLGRLPKKTKEMISIPEKFHLRFLSSLWFCSVWFWLTTLISLNFCPYEIDLKNVFENVFWITIN